MRRSKNPRAALFHLFTLLCVGALLMGWGGFNVIEGLVDHVILGVHHVNEQVPVSQWAYWDWGFILLGAAFFVVGAILAAGAGQGLARGAA